jgi:arylsulfatase A-like enzyme
MIRRKYLPLLIGLAITTRSVLASGGADSPNFVFILADDLGHGDLGCYGQTKIKTPNIDRLAASGVRFTRHYAGSPVCAPSRCVLMTGLHPGHAFVRDNVSVGPEGQMPLPAETVTLLELMQQAGYVTGAFGKWGLGPPGSTGDPMKQGCSRFFGYNCQAKAHNFYPTYLWDNESRRTLNNPDFSAHQQLPGDADPHDPKSYERYRGEEYSADIILAEAIKFLRTNKDRPFFLYYPSTIPHLALQVPEKSLAPYVGAFEETPYVGDRRYSPHPTPKAAYAAMVTHLDTQVGKLLETIRELGLDERTVVVFTSDNGSAENELGGVPTGFFRSAGDLRGNKGMIYEGGIRVPMIATWPGHFPAGKTSDRITGFEDWLPTLLTLAGQENKIPPAIDGIKFAPTLEGKSQPPRAFLYREFFGDGGQQAVWSGDWKAVRQKVRRKQPQQSGELPIELYNLKEDPEETLDVAEQYPDVSRKLKAIMAREHTPSPRFPMAAID